MVGYGVGAQQALLGRRRALPEAKLRLLAFFYLACLCLIEMSCANARQDRKEIVMPLEDKAEAEHKRSAGPQAPQEAEHGSDADIESHDASTQGQDDIGKEEGEFSDDSRKSQGPKEEDEDKVEPEVLEEALNQVPSLAKAKQEKEEGEFDSMLSLLATAQRELDSVEHAKAKEHIRRDICFHRGVALMELGRFGEASNELMRMQRLDRPAIELLQQAMKYNGLLSSPTEKSITEALEEEPKSPHLLKLRIDHRIQHGHYQQALQDVSVLSEQPQQAAVAERYRMHCFFLLGRYNEGMKLLKKQRELSFLYRYFTAILNTYNKARKSSTQENLWALRKLISKEILIAKVQDSKFKPSIFTKIKSEVYKKAIDMAWAIGQQAVTVQLLDKYVRECPDATIEDHADHISKLIDMKKFQSALLLFNKHKEKLEGTPLHEDLRMKYNRATKAAREQREKKEAEKRKKEEEEAQRALEDEKKKEKKAIERRKKFVERRRGRIFDPEGYYRFFGLNNGADSKKVKNAYVRVSRNANLTRRKEKDQKKAEQAKSLLVMANKAKEVLLNPVRKEEYDSGFYMTEKEKEQWRYEDEDVSSHRESRHRRVENAPDFFELFMNGGFGNSFDGFGFNDFGGAADGQRTRVVYYM